MNFTIRKLVLYPENAGFAPRTIDFEPDRINIITGTSQRGKSAVSKIIDYCLGASKCAIPVGIIRETVSWFAIEIYFNGKNMLLARKSPKNLNSSNDYYIEEKLESIVLPKSIEKNSTLDSLKSLINERLGLPNITLQPHAPEAFNAPPSYRDLVSFNYLPQHIVANPYTLFFRTEKTEYRERLTRMFPLALGIVDNKYYLLLSEQENLQKKVSELMKEENSIKVTTEKIKKNIIPYINKAKELGLIKKHFSFSNNFSDAIDHLKNAIEESKGISILSFFESQTSDAVEELVRSFREEDKTAQEIEKARHRLTRYRQLTDYMKLYSGELSNQTARTGILSWFRKNISESSSCILCGGSSKYSSHEIEWLQKMADSIESESRKISQEPIRLEKEINDIQRYIDDLQEKLKGLQKERAMLENSSKDAENARLSFQQVNQFIGRMQQAIDHIDYSNDSSEIHRSLESYKADLSSIKSQIEKYQIKKNQDESLFLISQDTKKYAKHLELERLNSKINFDVKELMLGFYSTNSPNEKEKPDCLYEIGSGENWMGYHIAFFLALHQKFRDVLKSPVFSFLIIDQPTQVYFPSVETISTYDIKKNAASNPNTKNIFRNMPTSPSNKKGSKGDDSIENISNDSAVGTTSFDADVTKAKRIFEVLAQSLKNTKEPYQIIVTEHADEDVWGDVELIHKVADWRGKSSDCYLVPTEWIEASRANGNIQHDWTETPEKIKSDITNVSSEKTPNSKTDNTGQKTLFDIAANEEKDVKVPKQQTKTDINTKNKE